MLNIAKKTGKASEFEKASRSDPRIIQSQWHRSRSCTPDVGPGLKGGGKDEVDKVSDKAKGKLKASEGVSDGDIEVTEPLGDDEDETGTRGFSGPVLLEEPNALESAPVKNKLGPLPKDNMPGAADKLNEKRKASVLEDDEHEGSRTAKKPKLQEGLTATASSSAGPQQCHRCMKASAQCKQTPGYACERCHRIKVRCTAYNPGMKRGKSVQVKTGEDAQSTPFLALEDHQPLPCLHTKAR